MTAKPKDGAPVAKVGPLSHLANQNHDDASLDEALEETPASDPISPSHIE
jgi:hypothetical protein